MRLFAAGRSLTIAAKEELVSGTVKDYIALFEFDDSWAGWTARAVFENITTKVAKEQLLDEDGACIVPWEVLEPGSLRVGIYGVMDDKVRPTIYSDRMTVREGTKAAESAKEPTPGIYEQLLASIENNAITGAELDENNHLIFTTKGGESFDAGELPMDEAITVNAPYIGENGNWYLWDPETDGYIDSGVNAQGGDGEPGPPGKRGDDGYTPVKGVDYWTPEDKAAIQEYIDRQIDALESDIEGIQEQINTEAHFRGYLSTNAKIQALEATPNDFAYSAESGTKWIYDAVEGWQDTGIPVPDQLTPASERTPLMDGDASVGAEEAYARGDHRHPTDTTRVGVEEFNEFKSELEIGLDNIITIQNTLIGGDSE